MVNLGVFEVAVLVGLFLLVAVVAGIGFLVYKRYTSESAESDRSGRCRTGGSAVRVCGSREAEDAALAIRAEAEAYAGEVRTRSRGTGPRPRGDPARGRARRVRQSRSELRDQRLDVERREQRLADREERLDSDSRALEEKARHLDGLKAELKAQRRTLAEAEADHQHALERIAGLTARAGQGRAGGRRRARRQAARRDPGSRHRAGGDQASRVARADDRRRRDPAGGLRADVGVGRLRCPPPG